MAADGSIVIDVTLNDANAQRGINNLSGGANRASGAFGALGKAVAAIGVIAIGSKLISSVKDFTDEAVKAAAAAQALNSQFSQVFGNLEDNATVSLKGIAEQTNILPERLKASFVQIAAFAKTAGFESAEALDLTTRATLAAADSAAFYDRSIESVTENLQSYLKGNYENDAALGLSSTETTRNAAANALYGKSFKDLSESQKQLTLLKMVEEANALSGALGQAAREGTAYENVQGNLTQAIENFKVAIGTNFLDLTVQGIVLLTKAIQSIDTEAIGAFLTKMVAYFTDLGERAIPVLIQAFNFVKEAIQQAVDFATPYIEKLKATWDSNSEGIFATVSNVFNKVKEVISIVVEEILAFIGPQLDRLKEFWTNNGEQIMQAITNAFNTIKAVIDFIMPAVVFVIKIAWDAIKDIIDGALNIIMGTIKIFTGIFTLDFSMLWEGIKSIFVGAIDLILGIMTLTFFGGIKSILTNLATTGINIVKNFGAGIVNGFKSFVTGGISAVKSLLDNVVEFFRQIAVKGLQFLLELSHGGKQYIDDLATGMINAISSLPGKFLQFGKDIIQGLINGLQSLNPIGVISNIAGGVIDAAKNIFGINSPSKVFSEIGGFISQGLEVGINKEGNSPVKAISNVASNTIDAALNEFGNGYSLNLPIFNNNSLRGLTSPSNIQSNGNYQNQSTSEGRTQINNITVETKNAAIEMQREVRKLNFGF